MGGMTALVGLLIALLVSSLPGATIVLVGVVIMSAAMPSWGLWLVLLAFPIHPLFVRIAEVDFGVSGLSLVIFSAWKEVALATTVVAPSLPRKHAARCRIARALGADGDAGQRAEEPADDIRQKASPVDVGHAAVLVDPSDETAIRAAMRRLTAMVEVYREALRAGRRGAGDGFG
jgi:hypothetical protein